MRHAAALPLAFAAALFMSVPVPAAETERLPDPVFRVWFTDTSGQEQTSFSSGDQAVLNVTFALALSELRSYPVTITLTMGGEETRVFEGRLDEGYWNVTEKIKVTRGPWKVTLRVRVTNRSAEGSTSFNSYTTVEGSF